MKRLPSTPVRVALLGAGTVGAAFARLAIRHPELDVHVALVRDPQRVRDLGPRPPRLEVDPERALEGAEVVVELLGGVDLATDLALRALSSGARVVSANKAALAERWDDWRPWIAAGSVHFEAAVMAGTPAIGPVSGALRGSRLRSLAAVLNGTCAYLIRALEQGIEFDAALSEAQRLGYAEADPSLDVDGIDAAHKVTLLARLSVDPDLPWSAVVPNVRGVRDLTPALVRAALADGERMRSVAFIEPDGGGGWRVGVEPRRVRSDAPLGFLGDGRNALVYRGDAVGEVWIAGPGAGAEVTASAVLADVLSIVRGESGPRLAPGYGSEAG
jgi:homoserine dehydrogenase